MMNLICVGDGDIPVMMEVVSGNQADKARFAGLLQEFKKQWTFEGICVADSALYSQENLVAMRGLKWLTRVPLSIQGYFILGLGDDFSWFQPSDAKFPEV